MSLRRSITKNKILIAIVGPSGSGKTRIARYLEEQFGWKQVESYTNRQKRSKNEQGHIFIKERDVSKIKSKYKNIVADDIFDGNYYFATKEQIDASDLYVISPSGIPKLKENYDGNKQIKVLYIKAPTCLRRLRMHRRGDNEDAVEQRIQHDEDVFRDAESMADAVLVNIVWSETSDELLKIVNKWRSGGGKVCSRKSRH